VALILALDQGTTSSRAMLFDERLAVRGVGQVELPQHFPSDGCVEHEPEDIWQTTLAAARAAIAAAGATASDIAGIGITNQRETTIVWDRRTGQAIHRAIVWQDRRTADQCKTLRDSGVEPLVTGKTGLLLDPYFSATKIGWLLDHVAGARAAAEAGHLAFGTVDSWLLWRLTGGRVHATDATNAARTLLFDIHRGQWDTDMLRLFRIPATLLPEVRDCRADFGTTAPEHFGGAIGILGMAGDQQAAAMGQACFTRGMLKATYGTGCFALLNTGTQAVTSRNRLLTTIATQLEGRRTYALEGAIFVAGAAVQWLRDGLGIVATAAETADLAADADPSQDVILVPAFVGLGAPQWRPDARGALFGLTRATGKRELARAALQAVAFQTRDLLTAMSNDWSGAGGDIVLRVDGGMTASDYTLQFLADLINAPVDRPVIRETTALGAAWLAGSRAGVMPDQDGFAALWQRDRRFTPSPAAGSWREARYGAWQRAVAAVIAQSNST
jgi:glycerol kinase